MKHFAIASKQKLPIAARTTLSIFHHVLILIHHFFLVLILILVSQSSWLHSSSPHSSSLILHYRWILLLQLVLNGLWSRPTLVDSRGQIDTWTKRRVFLHLLGSNANVAGKAYDMRMENPITCALINPSALHIFVLPANPRLLYPLVQQQTRRQTPITV